MRKRTSKGGLTVNAVAGTHVVTLGLDLSEERRDGCLGFAIQREDHSNDERSWMRGMKTFEATDPGLGPGGTVSSREHPIQGFQWADYGAKPNHDYTYTVVPLHGTPDKLKAKRTASVTISTEPERGKPHSVFFNRGAVASQEYARRFQDKAPDELPPRAQRAAYRWLSRGLLEALLAFIARADGDDYELYGAVYEFELSAVLEALRDAASSGAKVRVVYDGIPGDGNPGPKSLAAIRSAGILGLCTPRTTGTLMHNKFLVLVRRSKPIAVWTGSTNLTVSGVFGQLNCGHSVEDSEAASAYLAYWKQLGSNPVAKVEKAWMGENNPSPPDPWSSDMTLVFSPHRGLDVLDWYRDIAASAREALFMTFAFGMDKRFKGVYETDDDVLRIALMEKEGSGRALKQARIDIARLRRRRNVLVALGHRVEANAFDRWLLERTGLSFNVKWVHTKFMLVDPLSAKPVVVTGSANFSENSTQINNENMLVVRGDTRVADIYLGEFMRVYAHHAFRESLKRAIELKEPWRPQYLLADWAQWQHDHFQPGHDRYARRRYFARTD